MKFKFILVQVMFLALFSPYAQSALAACPPVDPVQASFTGANTQSGRIYRDGNPSTCPGKAYPGIYNVGTSYYYETFTYNNTSSSAACVTVNFDPNAGATPSGNNAHMSAYIGSYDPNNQAANFVGDVGSSITQSFSFQVPALSSLVLVVTNTSSLQMSDFAFQVVDLPCTDETPIPTLNEWGIIIFVMLIAGTAIVFMRRRKDMAV